ncbi:ABC transporter permease [Fusibacter ferrireducens]|uniref:ABC transporter permease n=1 Tax=Fusibacter ferrireducens TaxID=2785058 RepID=A0ABR9ZVF6_9FIRM|nr:ABC transporter permease [Fusibacter ferrireducens]MBF4694452.1 ABC transporter permease [Fusibacter ferrireducens]
MFEFIAKRFLWLIPVILGVTFFVFTIMYFTPGDPVRLMLGANATEQQIQQERDELGLNDSFSVRFVDYLKKVFIDFNLGNSYQTKQSVTDQILLRFPFTVKIALISVLLATLIGVPLGVLAATHQYSWKDNISMFGSLFCVSMPSFWFALILVMLFSQKLGWLPSSGIKSWTGYILPCVSIALGGAAGIARQTRSSMLEVIRQDYITTARAKGQKEMKVIFNHALKNALIPIIMTIGNMVGALLGGALIAETIFSIPGMGVFMMNGISQRDYPVVQGGVLFISVFFCLFMLLVDVVFAYVDPRIRSQYKSSKTKRRKGIRKYDS